MYSAILKAAALFVGGGIMVAIMNRIGESIIPVHQTISHPESDLPMLTDQVITWLPAVLVAMVAMILLASAALGRGGF